MDTQNSQQNCAKLKRNRAQKAKDLAIVAELMCRRFTVRQITEILNEQNPYKLSKSTISVACAAIMKMWRESRQDSIAEEKERELRGLDEQERECWAEWEKSKLGREVEITDVRKGGVGSEGGPGVGSVRKGTRKEGSCGDVSYQNTILAIRKRRAELLGLDEPTKNELSGPGGPVQVEVAISSKFRGVLQKVYGPKTPPAGPAA